MERVFHLVKHRWRTDGELLSRIHREEALTADKRQELLDFLEGIDSFADEVFLFTSKTLKTLQDDMALYKSSMSHSVAAERKSEVFTGSLSARNGLLRLSKQLKAVNSGLRVGWVSASGPISVADTASGR